ncbi:hypothetical protein GJ496_010203 [Pomphorhynchus laevis]|nr:hypothetical protein GJ496_010203 [Pomphorhynchus laevis]
MGTGSNACYMEDLDKVKAWTGDRDYPKQVIINTEWGAFGDNGCLENFRTIYDKEVDRSSVNPGKQKFEKMISGMYMGELARVIVHDLIDKKLIFQGLLEGKRNSSTDDDQKHIIAAGSFYTKFISDVETDEGVAFSQAKQLMEEFGIDRPTYGDCAVLKRICEYLSKRAALISAAAIAVLVNRIGKPKITIGVDGTLYRCHPKFKKNLDMGLSRLIARYIDYKVALSNDGSGRGAAICSAVQHRIEKEQSDFMNSDNSKPTIEISRSSSSPIMM